MGAFLGFLVGTVLVGMFVNELGELCPWASRSLVLLASRAVHRDPERAQQCAARLHEALACVPGKATLLPAALLVVGVFLTGAVWRSRAKDRVFTFLFAKMRWLRNTLSLLRGEVVRFRYRRYLRR
ncbi:hypothetical protein AB0B56_37480 [Streptosporangium canum]|uniref:hypothetical protein n=1 Tax=Streptosporangium canum TaxID=324952 RepID=UPI00343C869C